MSPTETDEPFEMLFGLWTRLVSRNHVLGWAQIPPQEKDQFWGFSDPLKCITVYKQQTLQTYPVGRRITARARLQNGLILDAGVTSTGTMRPVIKMV